MNGKGMKNDAFTYITALIFVMVIGITLTTGSAYWSTIMKREKEKELLFRGDQICRAIEGYYNSAPGGGSKIYPASLKDLLKDSRYLATKRYLRKIFKDPMTKDGQWGLIQAPGGKIKGVYSLSKDHPLKTADFKKDYAVFEKAGIYSDWRFVYPPEIESPASKAQAAKETKSEVSSKKGAESVQVEEEEEQETYSEEEESGPGDEDTEQE
jgi:type II secretory pathway pseudopilin PulG